MRPYRRVHYLECMRPLAPWGQLSLIIEALHRPKQSTQSTILLKLWPEKCIT